MAKKGLTEIVVILDRSGSMSMVKNDAIGGFNAFIEQQKKEPGEARVTIALFDHEYELLQDGVDISKVKPLNDATYVPRGSTALLDAIGRTINDVEARIKKAPKSERPEKVIAMVITDGEENASREFRRNTITELLKKQREDHKWEILFVGSDEASMKDAGSIGISTTRGAGGQSVSSTYSMNMMDSGAVSMAYTAMSKAVSNYRSAGTVGDWVNGEDLTKDTTTASSK